MDRRRPFLATVGTALVAGCLGALGGGDGDGDDGGDTDPGSDGGTDPSNGGASGDPTTTAGTATGGGSDPTTTRTTTESTPTPTPTPAPPPGEVVETVAEVEQVVPEREWARYRWRIAEETTLHYEFTVTEGPAIDALLMRYGQFRLFRRGQSANYIRAGTVTGSTGDRVVTQLSPGEEDFVLVFDNSRFGPTVPPKNGLDDPATVDIGIYLRR